MQNPFDMYQKNQSAPAPRKAKPRAKVTKSSARKPRAKKRKTQKSETPWTLLFCCAFGLSASLYVFMFTDELASFASRIDIGVTTGQAAEPEKTATEGKKEEEKSAPLPVGRVSQLKSDADHLTMKNASVYKALKEKRRELEKKERRLAQLEEELQIQKVEIEKQLKEMQSMRQNISQKLDRKVAADQESVDKLVGVYSNMKPQNAAVILSSVDEGLAVKVLGQMKKQNAAAILNYVNPKKAQVLSEKFTGLKQ